MKPSSFRIMSGGYIPRSSGDSCTAVSRSRSGETARTESSRVDAGASTSACGVGKRLDSGRTLMNYNIKVNATLTMGQRLRGGMDQWAAPVTPEAKAYHETNVKANAAVSILETLRI